MHRKQEAEKARGWFKVLGPKQHFSHYVPPAAADEAVQAEFGALGLGSREDKDSPYNLQSELE